MDIYKLLATGSSDLDAAASLDMQLDGHIVAANLEVWITGGDALNDGIEAEVSFASTNGFTSNDTKSSFIHAAAIQGFLTTGGSMVRARSEISGVAIEVAAGERLFIHLNVTGTVVAVAVAYLYVMPLADATARALSRRR